MSRAPSRSIALPRFGALMAALLVALPVLTAVSLGAAPAAQATVPRLHAPAGLPAAVEPLAPYVEQNSCHPGYLSGTRRLGQLLTATYRNTTFAGAYACGTDGTRSEHYDGRAIDWMNSIRNPTQAAQAASVIKFLLATDSHGNKFAMARRMGVMYIIWNNQMWGSWSGKWEPYNNCAKAPATSSDNACHRNHMHISLSWNGAIGRTSFWSHRTTSITDYGPCRVRDLNWATDWSAYNPKGCPSYPVAGYPAHSSAAMIALQTYSGAELFPGMTGGPVQAIQKAFRIPITGRYDGTMMARMKWFKRAAHLPLTYTVDTATWRKLLAAYRPK